jgi:hypothetical protein
VVKTNIKIKDDKYLKMKRVVNRLMLLEPNEVLSLSQWCDLQLATRASMHGLSVFLGQKHPTPL